ncbi:MAG TPA: SPFH domain-containing protein [Acidobacteriota bacterium]|jgi:membrane protease subunit (stomatin/prohibitin family)
MRVRAEDDMSQFMEIIEWFDQTGTEIVHRIPEQGSGDIKFGAQLIIRENQAAVFFRDGKGLDVFGVGRHTLTTRNLPILTKVLALPWGFNSPFRAEVCFVNMKIFTDLRWGTKDPVAFKDKELGLVRLRAFGAFTMQITQPLLFINTLVGTQGSFSTAQVEDFLREVVVSRLNDFLGEKVDSLFDLPQHYEEMALEVKERLVRDFRKYGIELLDFFINRITPPEDVQKRIDERSGMAAVGNLDRYFKFKAATAMGETASGSGSPASAGMGLGMGAGMGALIPGMLFNLIDGSKMTAREIAERGFVNCPECHSEVPIDSRFCSRCGHQMVVIRKCPRCDKNVTAAAKFCPACGIDLKAELVCQKCQTRLPPGTRFCVNCGEKI